VCDNKDNDRYGAKDDGDTSASRTSGTTCHNGACVP